MELRKEAEFKRLEADEMEAQANNQENIIVEADIALAGLRQNRKQLKK